MKIVIAGGTGLIGSKLVKRLTDDGNSVIILTRGTKKSPLQDNDRIKYVQWNPAIVGSWTGHLSHADAVINLSGESIAGKRWSDKQKEKIIQSRIIPTGTLVSGMEQISPRPGLLLNASAVGYYGNVEDGEVDESYPAGNDFLAKTCELWEKESLKASALGVRVVNLRTGLVLSREGGALPRLLQPFRFFVGGHFGSGNQWVPWIHIDDLVSAICFILVKYEIYGPVNGVSPSPVTMKQFSKILGKVMGRPSAIPVPAFVLKLMLGEMAVMLLAGQKAVPKKLLNYGFQFQFTQLDEALKNLLNG